MDKKPKICVVVVPRERYSLMRACIEHIYAFTQEEFEMIVIDQKTPAPVIGWVRQWAAKHDNLKIVSADKHLYPYECKNLALKHLPAEAEWVAFVDSDVKVGPQWLTWMIRAAEETGVRAAHPLYLFEHLNKVSIHMSDGTMLVDKDAPEKLIPVMNLVGKNIPEVTRLERKISDFLEFHTFLLRRDLLTEMGEFDRMTLAEDVHYSFRLWEKKEKIVFEPRSVITYVAGPPFEPYDLPYFRFRWNPESAKWSIENLAKCWPVSDKHCKGRYEWAMYHRSRVEPWFILKSKWTRASFEARELFDRAKKKAGRLLKKEKAYA